jgi:hypothetical protein
VRTRNPLAAPPGAGQAPDEPRMVSSIAGWYPVKRPSGTLDGPELARLRRCFVPADVVLADRREPQGERSCAVDIAIRCQYLPRPVQHTSSTSRLPPCCAGCPELVDQRPVVIEEIGRRDVLGGPHPQVLRASGMTKSSGYGQQRCRRRALAFVRGHTHPPAERNSRSVTALGQLKPLVSLTSVHIPSMKVD